MTVPSPSWAWRLGLHAMDVDVDGHLPAEKLSTVTTDTTLVLAPDGTGGVEFRAEGTAGAPDTADYLVGTAQPGLSAEIVVGTTPGGELGGTWASPTVDATHAGSTHIALSSATPLVESGAGSAGTGTAASKDDHVHPAAGGSGTLSTVKDEGTTLSSAVTSIDFVGAGVTATGTTAVTVTIPGGGSSSTGVPWIDSTTNPDKPAASPNAEDDEFDAGTLNAKWTDVNSVAETFAGSEIIVPMTSAATSEYRQSYAPGAGVAFTITAKFTGLVWIGNTDFAGLVVYDNSNAFIAAMDIRYASGFNFHRDNPGGAANQTTISAPSSLYVRIARDSSNNYTGSFSFDGLSYNAPLASTSSATTVDKIGFRIGSTQATTWRRGAVDWFRRT